MGLKDFFRRSKPTPFDRDSVDDFWQAVMNLCKAHVLETIAFFKSKQFPRIGWAEPRFLQLVKPPAIEGLLIESKRLLNENPNGVVQPVFVETLGSWRVMLSVFPSAVDAYFLSACPGGSFENLARQARLVFRREIREWEDLNYAHWILLLNKQRIEASIHLHTVWSLVQNFQWFISGGEEELPKLISAPVFVPMDLMKEDFSEFHKQLKKEDAAYSLQNRNRV